MKKFTTDELLKILNEQTDIKQFASTYANALTPESLVDFVKALLDNRNLSKSDVIKLSGLDRTYAYQIFNGTKSPSRDKVIALAFGFRLNSTECNRLLMLAGFSGLYPKVQRDSCIIFSLDKNYNIITANELLHDLGEKIIS